MAYSPEQFSATGSETGHQMALMLWAQQNRTTWPVLRLLFAIPNGGHRDKREAARLKQAGVKAGVPDLCLPVARGGFLSCWLELKKPADVTATGRKRAVGRVADKQTTWAADLREQGHAVVTAYGYEQARAAIVDYLALGPSNIKPAGYLGHSYEFLKKHCEGS